MATLKKSESPIKTIKKSPSHHYEEIEESVDFKARQSALDPLKAFYQQEEAEDYDDDEFEPKKRKPWAVNNDGYK